MKIVEHTVTTVIYSDTVHWQKEIPNEGSMNVLPKSKQLNISYWSVILLGTQCVFLLPSPWMKPLKMKATEHYSSVVQAPDVQQVNNASHRLNWHYTLENPFWFR